MDKLAFCFLSFLVFIVPWEENFATADFGTFSRILGALAFLFGVAAMLATLAVKRLDRALVPLGLFVVWSFMSTIWSINRDETWSLSMTYLLLLLFAWLIWQYGDSPSRQQWLMRAYVFGTAVALAGLFLGVWHGGEGQVRYAAAGSNQNTMAASLVVAVNFAVYLVTRRSEKRLSPIKAAYWAFIVAASVGVWYTGSRSGVIALAVSIILMLVTVFRVVGWKPAAIFVFCVGVGGYLILQFAPGYLLARQQEGTAASSFHDRVGAWQAAVAQWANRPLQGFGSNTHGGPGLELAHNTLVSILVDNGLIGLGLYVAFWILLLLALFSLPKAEKTFWLVVFTAYGPTFLSGSCEHDKTLWFLCALVLTQAATLRRAAAPPPPTTWRRTARLRPA